MRASLAPLPMRRGSALPTTMTTFEQVLIANSAIIVAGTLVTFLFTRLSQEPWHYLIATGCVVGITIAGVLCNAWLLRRAFAPLFSMLTTIQEVQRGAIERRVTQDAASADIAQLAQAFNMMLDSLDGSRRAALLAVAQAQEDERRHIALELHDATGQELTGLLLRLEMVRQDLDEEQPDLAAVRRQIETIGRRHARRLPACNRWHNSCARPSSTIWDSNPRFGAWSTSWGRRQSTSARWSSSLMAGAPEHRLAPLVETMLYRVAQEALTNAVRHSRARHIHVRLTRVARQVSLLIRDDGQGFTMPVARQGNGLTGMRERMDTGRWYAAYRDRARHGNDPSARRCPACHGGNE